jgi:hypothetical protein
MSHHRSARGSAGRLPMFRKERWGTGRRSPPGQAGGWVVAAWPSGRLRAPRSGPPDARHGLPTQGDGSMVSGSTGNAVTPIARGRSLRTRVTGAGSASGCGGARAAGRVSAQASAGAAPLLRVMRGAAGSGSSGSPPVAGQVRRGRLDPRVSAAQTNARGRHPHGRGQVASAPARVRDANEGSPGEHRASPRGNALARQRTPRWSKAPRSGVRERVNGEGATVCGDAGTAAGGGEGSGGCGIGEEAPRGDGHVASHKAKTR